MTRGFSGGSFDDRRSHLDRWLASAGPLQDAQRLVHIPRLDRSAKDSSVRRAATFSATATLIS